MEYKLDFDKLIASIKKHEGFRSRVYKDILGNDTIGYGTAIDYLEITESVAAIILQLHVYKLSLRIYQTFPWYANMPAPVKAVMVEMCYQMGLANFTMFKKTILYLQNEQWLKASKEMLDSAWARVQSPERAKRLSARVAGVK